MNLADYLSELLGQYDEVSVPGLGYFIRERVTGYYNEAEGRFYPPHHKVKFVAEPKDDEIFAHYVAERKNITLASSKYFAEKFVSKLKEQALSGKYLFADLGLFYSEKGQLMFKPNDKISDDPAFYGLSMINAHKIVEEKSGVDYAEYEPVPPKPVDLAGKQQNYEEDLDGKKTMNVWMIILMIVAIFAVAAFGLYRFFPATFNRVTTALHITKKESDVAVPVKTIKTAPVIEVTVPPPVIDTNGKALIAKPDTGKNGIAATVESKPRFAVILHDKYRKLSDAVAEVRFLKSEGIEAEILPPMIAAGPLHKISFKKCATEAEAKQVMLQLVNEGKINKDLELFKLIVR